MTSTKTPDDPALTIARGDWAGFGLAEDIRPALAAAREAGEACALATLFHAHGGAPRGVGAQMLVRRGSVSGFLSGGCIEADVTLRALDVLADGVPRRLVYGEGGPIDIRLPCGGRVEILIERIAPGDEAAGELLSAWRERRPVVWITDGTRRSCIHAADAHSEIDNLAGVIANDPQGTVYRHYFPQPRLFLFGSDPMVLALGMVAAQSGVETSIVRPKGPLSAPPVPGVIYRRGAPVDELREAGVDRWTGIVVAQHDDFDDREALLAALPSPAGYVGLLGAKRHLPRKLEQLRRKGLDDEHLARLRAPVGLPIGGRSPWQIAISILAEFMQWLDAEQKAQASGTERTHQRSEAARTAR